MNCALIVRIQPTKPVILNPVLFVFLLYKVMDCVCINTTLKLYKSSVKMGSVFVSNAHLGFCFT